MTHSEDEIGEYEGWNSNERGRRRERERELL